MSFFNFGKYGRMLMLSAVLAVGVLVGITVAQSKGTLTDSRDGQKYKTVKIGGKTWMAQNLNYQTGNSWCYGGDNSNCNKYGRLYDWNTAKIACLKGWHLPSREEWGALAVAAGGTGSYGNGGTAGRALGSASGWDDDGNGTDSYGFSALPGGCRDSDGFFYSAGYNGFWWTATERSGDGAYYRVMGCYDNNVGEGNDDKSYGFSARCVQD